MHIFSSNVHDKILDGVETERQVIVVAPSQSLHIYYMYYVTPNRHEWCKFTGAQIRTSVKR